MTIYVDIVLFENIIMNYIILFSEVIINKEKIHIIRIIIASLIGAIYAIILYIFEFEIMQSNILKIILSIVMVYVAFKPLNVKQLIKKLLLFYLISFTFGGATYALFYYINPKEILIENGSYSGTYPIKMAILGGILGAIIIILSFKYAKGQMKIKNMFCKILISINNKTVSINALIDSGNMLKDPITKEPVVLVEKRKMKSVLPVEFNYEKMEFNEEKNNLEKRIRIIPFSTIENENNVMIGIKTDYIEIEFEDEKNKIENITVGLFNKKLSKNDKYAGLIGLNLIERRGI